jgi:para-nitrobenzyl esterase
MNSRNSTDAAHSDASARLTARRDFLKTASTAALLAPGLFAAPKKSSGGPPVTETTCGQVRGLDSNGVKTFRGIPYGADTSGKNRFMPPTKPAKWAGVRECTEYGHISPQTLVKNAGDYEKAIEWDKERGGLSEDCLNLNIWTRGLKDGVKRPVLVSYHGGGYTTGSGNLPGYDGESLAHFADVVVVTVNHRLGPLGYTYLGDIAGPDFAYSGVAGMMDCVQSLEWIRDNIENFGGNPANVFIFGQSGGGAKTSTLLSMPSAKGLFHRAAVQSGSTIKMMHKEMATPLAAALLAKVGIDKSHARDLQNVPFEKLIAAGGIAGPSVDGKIIPRDPFDPTAPDVSADIPMIIGTALDDAGLRMTDWDLDEAGLKKWVGEQVGATHVDHVLEVYRKAFPNTKPFLIKTKIATDRGGRRNATTMAERKAALGHAAAYLYRWDWPSPAYGGKFGAIHGTDVSLCFHNTLPPILGDTAESHIMADRMGSVWVQFAKTGNPNCKQIPHWPAYEAEKRPTMLFDLKTRVENDPAKEVRLLWDELRPA